MVPRDEQYRKKGSDILGSEHAETAGVAVKVGRAPDPSNLSIAEEPPKGHGAQEMAEAL